MEWLYRLLVFLPLLPMALAKLRQLWVNDSISEIAYDLGFKYPQHFTRSFKQHVGYSPNEYR